MDKKKISSGLRTSGFWLAIITLFMCFAPALYNKEVKVGGGSLFDYMFKKGSFDGTTLHYNAIYIIGFVLMILAIIALAIVLITKLTGNENGQLNKGLTIAAIACLVIFVVFAFCTKAVYAGELYKYEIEGEKLDPSYVKEMLKHIRIGSGAICSGIFGLFGAGALTASLVIDK